MKRALAGTLLVFGAAACAVLACTPTLWSVSDLIYNLGAESPDTVVVRLFTTRDAVGEYGTYVSGFRHVCLQDVMGAPATCPSGLARRAARTPGPGPGPCYFRVVDFGQEPFGSDLTPAHCESLNAAYALVVE